jgi:pSer/pThr/pTyr-binding forkhead associated (FHA) protein
MKVQLLVLNEGPMKGKVVRLPVREFTIGREASCHLRPTSEAVAPRHCVIRVFGADVSVEDLGSPSGTLVNGQKIRGKVPLKVGDKISVGPLAFELSVERPAPARLIVETSDEEAAAMIMDDEEPVEPVARPQPKPSAVSPPPAQNERPKTPPATSPPPPDSQQNSADAARNLLNRFKKK